MPRTHKSFIDRLTVLVVVILASTATPAVAQYPSWSQVTPSVFNEIQFPELSGDNDCGPSANQTCPSMSAAGSGSPGRWILPFPDPSVTYGGGSWLPTPDDDCHYNDYYVSGQAGNPAWAPMQLWGAPFGGSSANQGLARIQRGNPTYIQRTDPMVYVQGIGVQMEFVGDGPASETHDLLIQSAFFHSQKCYSAPVEFGFTRFVNDSNVGSADNVTFYYSKFTNCPDLTGANDVCYISFEASDNEGDPGFYYEQSNYNTTIAIPSGTNSVGRKDWLYLAWLENNGGRQLRWVIKVKDPVTYADKITTEYVDINEDWFETEADIMLNGAGLAGFMTATSNVIGPWDTSDIPSSPNDEAMIVYDFFAP